MFSQTSLNHPVRKRVLPLCAHSLPFGNELIRVLHRLYQQIFKETMLNKVARLAKDES
jgi:hypothetical protein